MSLITVTQGAIQDVVANRGAPVNSTAALPTSSPDGSFSIVLDNTAGIATIYAKVNGIWTPAGGGGGGGGTWGSITGILSNQLDLQNALNLKSNLVSPAFTGTPTAPTATIGTNTTQIATTAFVVNAASNLTLGGLSGVTLTAPTTGQVLSYNGTNWINAASGSGGGTWGSITGTLSNQTDLQNALNLKIDNTLSSSNILVGNASNVATAVAMTGDVAITNAGVTTVQAGAITGSKIANTTITAANIVNNTITATQIANATITGTQIAATTITAANIVSGTITGTQIASNVALAGAPTTTTATAGDNSTKIATTAFVANATSALTLASLSGVALTSPSNGQVLSYNGTNWVNAAGGSGGGTWGSITGTLSNQTDLQNALNLKADLTSPALTGIPTAPTATVGTNTTQVATTAYVDTLTAGNIKVGNSSNIATAVALSGDATITNAGVLSVANSTNLKNGVAGAVPYQSGVGTTGFSAAGTTGQVLSSNGAGAPTWANATATPTASTLAKWDVDVNLSANNLIGGVVVFSSGTSFNVTVATPYNVVINNAAGVNIDLPDARTLSNGTSYYFINQNLSQSIALFDGSGAGLIGLNPQSTTVVTLINNGSIAGSWQAESGNLSGFLTSAHIYVGNASNAATAVAVTGDVSLNNAGVITVGAGAITGSKIANTTITAANIVNNTITATQIANATITGTQIASNIALAGAPTTTTATAGDNSTKIATTGFVATSYAPLASPALTGTPTAPTPTFGDSSTNIATTAFVTQVSIDGGTF